MALKRSKNNNYCIVPGCNKLVTNESLCSVHFNVKRRQGYIAELEDNGGPLWLNLKNKMIAILKKPASIRPWFWVYENYTLPESERKGFQGEKIDFDIQPDIKEVYDWLDDPDVEQIVFCTSAQTGKTLFILGALKFFLEYKKLTGLFHLPTDYLFKIFPQTRLEPILNFDHAESKRPMYKMTSGNYLRVGLATNASSLAEMAGQFVLGDEIDEIKQTLKIDPLELAKDRLRTAHEPKEILCSTPKIQGGGITQAYENTKRHEVEQPCPHCGEYIIITFENIKYPEGAESDDIKEDRLAYVVCESCSGIILDQHHEEMVRNQRLRCLDPEMRRRRMGIKKRVWNTIFMSWSDVAAKYEEVKNDPEKLSDFYHSYCAEVIDTFTDSEEIESSNLTGNYFRETRDIPAEVKFLSAGVDLGKNEAWFTLLGWGDYGEVFEIWDCRIEREPGQKGWDKMARGILHACDLSNYNYLGHVSNQPYFVGGLFDSGYDTNLVYQFCKENALWFPVKGDSSTPRPFDKSRADPKRKFGGKYSGLVLYVINPHHWEDVLQSMLETGSGKNGFNVPEDVHDRYIQHLKASIRKFVENSKGKSVPIWVKKYRNAQNHLRDASYYAVAFGHIKGLHILKPREENRQIKKPSLRKSANALKTTARTRF